MNFNICRWRQTVAFCWGSTTRSNERRNYRLTSLLLFRLRAVELVFKFCLFAGRAWLYYRVGARADDRWEGGGSFVFIE